MEKQEPKEPKDPGPVIPPEKLHRRKRFKLGFMDKIFVLIAVISLLYLLYLTYQDQLIALLQKNAFVWAVVSHITAQIAGRTFLGFLYATFFGSLFFITLPLELLFLYYYSLDTFSPLLLVGIAVGAITLGLSLDYFFGRLLGERALRFFIRDDYDRFHKLLEKWGALIIFVGSLVVFPIQIVAVVIGAGEFSFKKFFFAALLGTLLKYTALVFFGNYIVDLVLPWLTTSVLPQAKAVLASFL